MPNYQKRSTANLLTIFARQPLSKAQLCVPVIQKRRERE
jgi:hypothetical protein